jgi:surface antigen
MKKRLAAAVVAASLGFFAVGVTPSAALAADNARDPYWQCVTFARMFSGINIFGDACDLVVARPRARFRTGRAPETGSVLAFRPRPDDRGHVAVVSDILTDRVIRVTHANWGGSRGKVEENVTVVDVSEQNDWTRSRSGTTRSMTSARPSIRPTASSTSRPARGRRRPQVASAMPAGAIGRP